MFIATKCSHLFFKHVIHESLTSVLRNFNAGYLHFKQLLCHVHNEGIIVLHSCLPVREKPYASKSTEFFFLEKDLLKIHIRDETTVLRP